MTENEQAVREWLAGNTRNGVLYRLAEQALALLDAKDAEISNWWRSAINAGSERDTALSRAEQAEAALAEERKAHQAFRAEVSEAVLAAAACGRHQAHSILSRFILPAKPADLFKKAVEEANEAYLAGTGDLHEHLCAAIERAGGTIEFPDALLAQRSKTNG